MKKYVFIDYENVNNITSLPKIDGTYFLFVGHEQGKKKVALEIAFEMAEVIQSGGGKFIKIPYTGKNALDMHLAFYLGMVIREFDLSGKTGDFQIYIVSKDGDFDKLVGHLKKVFGKNSAFKIKDISELEAPAPADGKAAKTTKQAKKTAPAKAAAAIEEKAEGNVEKKVDGNLEKAFVRSKENILKRPVERRPKTIKSFKNQINKSKGNNDLTDDEVNAVFELFLAEKIISTEGKSKKVSYSPVEPQAKAVKTKAAPKAKTAQKKAKATPKKNPNAAQKPSTGKRGRPKKQAAVVTQEQEAAPQEVPVTVQETVSVVPQEVVPQEIAPETGAMPQEQQG